MSALIKPRLFIVLALLTALIFTLSACGEEDAILPVTDNPGVRIMPLGASRVEGDRPEFESYRYELWRLMIDKGWEFDFVGTMNDPASYPDNGEQIFDIDHEGRGGWTSGQILAGVQGWIDKAGAPEIVLFSSPGGNDALLGLPFEEAVDNINGIIDILQAANPNVTILIEQMAPGRSDIMTTQLTQYFEQMQAKVIEISAAQSTTTSSVIPVDMYTDFNDRLLADDVHYNEAGARFIADRYLSALENVIQ